MSESGRRAGETDAHVIVAKHLGLGWAAAAAAADVLKGFLLVGAARSLGHLPSVWLGPVGVALVAGHTYPPYQRQMAGRGLSAASGVLMALLPMEMVAAGIVILAGYAARVTGPATTLALASVPPAAAAQGQPAPLVGMAAAILVLVLLRRLEGVRDVVHAGVSPGRAVLYRCLFDASGPPSHRGGTAG
jgi:glycerol-3-phosphate acyltransferase PlsY